MPVAIVTDTTHYLPADKVAEHGLHRPQQPGGFVRLVIENDRVTGEEHLLTERG